MKKAIVFAGGGSKGAYEIGAWKALNELGEHFDIATGTSIGSINAAFYVQHDFDAAYEMWKTITAGDIMANGMNFEKSLGVMFSQREQIKPFLKGYIASKGADVTPFYNCLKQYFSPEKFAASDIDYALMTVCFTTGLEPREVSKQEIIDRGENGWQWIAASASAFPAFPMMHIDGANYIDGGYYDNIPVAAAFKRGAQRVTVIELKHGKTHEGYANHPYVTIISPTRDLGAFLNFDRSVIDRSIRLGYCDTMKEYRRYFGYRYTFIPGEYSEDEIRDLAEKYIDTLTFTEANHNRYDSVRFHRINALEGCAGVLHDRSYDNRTDCESLFFAALEIYLDLLGFDDTKDYTLNKLVPALKKSLEHGCTLSDLSGENAFSVFYDYLVSEYDEHRSTLKEYEDDNIKLIAVSLAKTLLA